MQPFNLPNLPITEFLPELVNGLRQTPNWVLQAQPGAGKSTLVPLALLADPAFKNQKILMLEPRRLAVRTLAHYLAKQLGESVGQTIGYQVRNDRRISNRTRLEIITEGILTRRLQQDPELNGVGLVIFDEFHERSIHADLALSLCLDVQLALRPDLKLLVMSATLDTDAISQFLNQAPVLKVPGRTFEVTTHYAPQPIKGQAFHDWSGVCIQMIQQALQNSQQDLLVFLPGQGEIKRLQALLEAKNWPGLVVFPLYGSLPIADQEAAILPDAKGRRKIVLTTNLAETSLTIEGVDAVVDTGWTRKAIYDVSSGMTRLVTQPVSKASAEQRRGRAGRLRPGCCYRLWSESQQLQKVEFDSEEITQTDLTQLCLELAQWGVKSFDELAWLTPPPRPHFQAAIALLNTLGLLAESGQLTAIGQQAAQWPIHPRLARLLIAAQMDSKQVQSLACDLVALLTEGDCLQSPEDADLVKRLLALQTNRMSSNRAQKNPALRSSKLRQVIKTATLLRHQLGVSLDDSADLSVLQTHTGCLLASAYPDRIAQLRSGQVGSFKLSNGKGAVLPAFDALSQSPWLVVAELDGQRQSGRIYLAAAIQKADIQALFSDKIHCKPSLQFDAKNKILKAVERCHFGKLLLSETPLPPLSATEFHQAILPVIQHYPELLPWSVKTQAWLNRVVWLTQFDADWPNFSQAWLLDNLSIWLMPYLNGIETIQALQKLDLLSILKAQLSYEQLKTLDEQAPQHYVAPSGLRVPIQYSHRHEPKVSIVLQEVFGQLRSPLLAWGQKSLTFELLSPARRPIQTTADLAHFWETSYFDVIKDMKGRYPKHRWPEHPLTEKAGKSIKRH